MAVASRRFEARLARELYRGESGAWWEAVFDLEPGSVRYRDLQRLIDSSGGASSLSPLAVAVVDAVCPGQGRLETRLRENDRVIVAFGAQGRLTWAWSENELRSNWSYTISAVLTPRAT